MKARAIGYEKSVSTDEWRSPTVAMFFALSACTTQEPTVTKPPHWAVSPPHSMGLFWSGPSAAVFENSARRNLFDNFEAG